jgi:putative protease
MNSRDLMAIDYLPELSDAWIISFKIEWRNKTVNYIASVWLAYRKALDAVKNWEEYDSKELSSELFWIANRWYIPGFLAWNTNANAQFYERNWSYWTKAYLWILREYDKKNRIVRIEVKNQFNLWDKIELVSPSWIKELIVEKIYKTKINHWTNKANTIFNDETSFNIGQAEEVQSAHWWWYEVWINLENKPEDFSLIRKDV